MSRLVTHEVGPRPERQITNRAVFKSPAAEDLLERACACCGERPGDELHHVVSRAQRGDDVIENLVGLCRGCHDRLHHAPDARDLYLVIGLRMTPQQIDEFNDDYTRSLTRASRPAESDAT